MAQLDLQQSASHSLKRKVQGAQTTHEESAAGLCQRLAIKEYAHVVYTANVLALTMFTVFSVAQGCCKVA